MLTDLCQYLRNWFVRDRKKDIHAGTYAVSGGRLEDVPFLQDGQYFRIVGSVFNDGVYQYPIASLTDETFTGAIWAMAVPLSVIDLADEIKEWAEKNAEAISSPYQSESFGGYTYSKRYSQGSGNIITWQLQFASRLNQWRKI